ncbi:MAG: SufE family protein [Simkaniaceae bacterium]
MNFSFHAAKLSAMNFDHVKKLFTPLTMPEERYKKIIELGFALSPYPLDKKTPEHLVPGCQSTLYLFTSFHEDKLNFLADSDALISRGLAALLILAYRDFSIKDIVTHPPLFLKELNLLSSLSPTRSNGLLSLYTLMRSQALSFIKN